MPGRAATEIVGLSATIKPENPGKWTRSLRKTTGKRSKNTRPPRERSGDERKIRKRDNG